MKTATPLPIHVLRRGLPTVARNVRLGKPVKIVCPGGSKGRRVKLASLMIASL